jgi:hypothetical protein
LQATGLAFNGGSKPPSLTMRFHNFRKSDMRPSPRVAGKSNHWTTQDFETGQTK